ncbi:DUF4760 domain-containing protein [Denitromonas iodatirespirans]|uniref:DUF4760 domain-containing protein n=1 Tax=Denitromonas iodatirespirans TaxID=2795389 RepID=A0A944DG33_DENI1|nr:DUF4760 domain-containing protein [Denitromonas iodatirespirans]MBT0962178.1 DUF4760 domain-containing protein [Denitromonas iodatirespirans]
MIFVIVAAFCIPVGLWLLRLDPTLGVQSLDAKEWIGLYALLAAILGWLLAAWVQVRNSIKQHTVNTMLQSRLSTAYQDKAAKFLATYPSLPEFKCVQPGDWLHHNVTLNEGIEAARYLLNYYEFIAVGIRNGDFDEKLMRQSWRKIVVNLCVQTHVFIQYMRRETGSGTANQPKVYEHLLWLVDRWAAPGERAQLPWLDRKIPVN